jgi:ABC-type Na+ efflux pump permease subunit
MSPCLRRWHDELASHVHGRSNRNQTTRSCQKLLNADEPPRQHLFRDRALVLLLSITSLGDVDAVQNIANTLEVLPAQAQAQIKGDTPQGRTSYALAVFLFAPMAVVVPLTISTAVGAATLVGERERGTGEFLAHSPAATKEIYLGELMASPVPGYFTTMVGFTLFSLIVNLIVGPEVGGWFFPTQQWWLLMLWVLPGFLLIGLSLVLRLSGRVKSTAATQQASGLITPP